MLAGRARDALEERNEVRARAAGDGRRGGRSSGRQVGLNRVDRGVVENELGVVLALASAVNRNGAVLYGRVMTNGTLSEPPGFNIWL